MKAQTLFVAKNKSKIGLFIIGITSILVLVVPELVGLEIPVSLRLTSLVLLSVYVLLSFELIHRTVIAMTGATIVIVIGITTELFSASASFDFVLESIDFNTIGLLLGMMIIVAILGQTGVFQFLAIKMSKASKGNMWRLMLYFSFFTAIASMFLDNVTTILVMVPITISVFRVFRISPIPFILAQVFVSNVAGTATLIGDPPNILIGSAAGIDFNSFIVHMGPTIAVTFVASLFIIRFLFRKVLAQKPANLDELLSQDEMSLITDRPVLKKSLIVFGTVIFLFFIHGTLHIEPSVITLSGAGILMLVARSRPEKILHEVDWTTLIFFAGLFVIISVAEAAGVIELLSNTAIRVTGGDPWLMFFMIIWLSAIASSFSSNIPFTVTMIPLIFTLNNYESVTTTFGSLSISPLWWALSLGAGLGGNGTLVASSAGIVATGLVEKIDGYRITFNQFLRMGFPFMIITTAIGSIVLFMATLMRLTGT